DLRPGHQDTRSYEPRLQWHPVRVQPPPSAPRLIAPFDLHLLPPLRHGPGRRSTSASNWRDITRVCGTNAPNLAARLSRVLDGHDAVICATASSSDGVASSAAASCVLLIIYVYDAALLAASGSDHLCIFEGANCLHCNDASAACGARVS